jgi:hypothetical protein
VLRSHNKNKRWPRHKFRAWYAWPNFMTSGTYVITLLVEGLEGMRRELRGEGRMYKRNTTKCYQHHCYLKCIVSRTVKFLGLYFIIRFCFYWNVNCRLWQLAEGLPEFWSFQIKKKSNQNTTNYRRNVIFRGGAIYKTESQGKTYKIYADSVSFKLIK